MSRIFFFDVLRILSCLMIVLMHSQKAGVGTPGWLLAGSGFAEAAGIGLFFMISGSLVLSTPKSGIESLSFSTFLKHRMIKILIPLLFWYSVYTFTQYIDLEWSGRGVLWFLWTMGGLYLLSPILMRWLHHASNKEILFYLALWGVSLLYPVIKLFADINLNDTSWLYYFHGYVGYFVLGYYCHHRVSELTMWQKALLAGAFIAFSVITPLSVFFFGIKVDFFQLFWYLSWPVVLQCIVWFFLIRRLENCLQKMEEKKKKAIQWISSQTFGIYLIHILIMRGWLWNTEWIQSLHSVTHLAVCAVSTFVLSMLATSVIRRIPYLRMVVGG